MKPESLKDLCHQELADLLSAENQLLEALPSMAQAAHSQNLKAAFESHLLETREHVRRLEEVLRSFDTGASQTVCQGMATLITAAKRIQEMDFSPELKDAALISAAQRVEHYEFAAYSSVIAYCDQLEEMDAKLLLTATLTEEQATSARLTELATAEVETASSESGNPTTSGGIQEGKQDSTTISGKRVLITGGTTGIGRAIALKLAGEGARVMIFGRDKQHLEDALKDLRKASNRVIGTTADASNGEDMIRVFDQMEQEFGGLDILINNAALGASGVEETPDDEREYVLLTNISGYLRCCHLAVPRMKEGGQIILIGSISADEQNAGSSIYVATKSAIQGFSESFREEVAEQGIRVSLVEPGKTGSDMIEADVPEQRKLEKELRMLKAEDVAESVSFILTQSPRTTISVLKIRPAKPGA